MKSIRKGNDIQVKWTILRDGLPEDFSGKSLILKLFDDIGYSTIIKDYQVKDNQILFTVFGKDQKSVGIYKATLYENTGIPKMATIDACNLFQLVDCSCKQGGTDDNNITTETVEFTSEFNLSGGFYILTKQEIEEVLTGDILSHNHNTQLKEYLDNNLKTINNESIIGKGNITIEADKSEVEVNDTGIKPTQDEVVLYADLSDDESVDILTPTPIISQTLLDTAIEPNVYNKWGEVASLKITLTPPTDATIVNPYWIEFKSGTTATTLLLPDTIKWLGGSAPTIESNKTYQISIQDNLAVIGGF